MAEGAGLLNAIIEAVFPGRCLLCGHWLFPSGDSGAPVCSACRAALPRIVGERCGKCSAPLSSELGTCRRCRETDYAFDSNLSLFEYSGAIKQLIAEFKFSGRIRLSRLFASLLAMPIRGSHPGIPVVPVPPRPRRRTTDAVGMIAECLRRDEGLPILALLERTGGVAQKSLDFDHRRENLRGRIRLAGPKGPPREVVLLDDVFTTGATADACAGVLRAAGCCSIFVVTLALD